MKGKAKSKKQQIILLAIILLLCISAVGVFLILNFGRPRTFVVMQNIKNGNWDVSWYDDDEDEFVLTTKEQLFGLAELSQEKNFKGKTIKLGADIVINEGNAEDWQEESPNLKWMPIGTAKYPFNGTFDGQGHTISGIYCNGSDDATGFFKQTGTKCQIKNLKIVNSYYKMRGDQGVGSIAGVGLGLFSQIYSDAIIECDGWRAGGIMGSKSKDGSCAISECWFDGKITISGRFAGGIVGGVYAGECTIQHCHNTGDIFSTFPGPQAATIGGIAGYVSGILKLTDSFNSGTIISEADRAEVAAIIGAAGATAEIASGYMWATSESASFPLGSVNAEASVLGTFLQLPEELLTGYSAYQRVDLDFDKYWAVVEDDTPMLQFFADSIPSLAGKEKCMVADTTWYDVTKMENIITTPEQLKGFAMLAANGEKFYGKTIKLGADIVYNTGKVKDYAKNIPLNLWVPVDNFMGTFDGQGHTISGLFVNCATDHVGMFAFTEEKATIKNFKLTNSYFERTKTSGNYGCASIAGAGGGTFEKIYSDAIVVTANRNGGGIVGQFNRDGSVSECWFDGEVAAANRFAGGIIGGTHPYSFLGKQVVTEVKVQHCLNTGYIHRTDKDATDKATYAGIVGLINNTITVEDCFNAGVVTSPMHEKTGKDELGAITAGVAANAKATIKNCWGTTESFQRVLSAINKTSVTKLTCTQVMVKELLTGYDAVKFTTLNFNKYWAVDLEGTPVLQCFAKKAPSVAGILTPNLSWYKENQKEYVITTKEQLYGLSILANSGVTFEGKTVKLGKDITVNTGDAASWKTTAATDNWFPIKDFAGIFDGQGYTISGLYSVDTPTENIGRGLFTKTVEKAVIQNLRLVNSFFETQTVYAVAAVSSRGCGTFKNIYTNAIVNNIGGNNTGGILGLQLWASATIENCWFDGSITDVGRRIGGMVGYTGGHDTTVAHCLFSGSISRVGDKVDENMALAGGMVGCAQGNVTVSDCLSVGTLSSERKTADAIGSLIGETVKNSTVKLQTLYATESSYSKTVGYNGSKAKVSDCIKVADAYLKGENASLFTLLDYSNYWAIVKGEMPQLKTFASGNVISNPKRLDTSWYKANDKAYTISNMEDLYGLRLLSETVSFAGKVIHMDKDIDVNATKDGKEAQGWKVVKAEYLWLPIQNFKGEFDGNGFAISGLCGAVSSDSKIGMGLFSKTGGAVNVHDLSLMNSYFESKDVNGLAGIASQASGTFKNIHTNVILYNENTGKIYMGGIVGLATGTLTIEDCWSEADIDGAGRYAGGMLGSANGKEVTIEHCLNSGDIHRFGTEVNSNGRADYGGIIGSATAGNVVTVNDCLNTGNVTSDRTKDWDALGSIAGEAPGKKNVFIMTNCYALEGTCGDNGLVFANVKYASVEDSAILSEEQLQGLNAIQNTTLDFMDRVHWVVKGDENVPSNEFPALETFVNEEDEYRLYGVIKYDTRWYNTTTKSGTITDKWDLYGFAQLVNEGLLDENSTVILGNDVMVNTVDENTNVSDWKTTAPEYTWTPIGTKEHKFAGSFDGQGYTISGIYVKSSTAGLGLFGYTATGSAIQNLKLEKTYIHASADYAGGVVGVCAGNLINVFSDVIMDSTNSYVGGLLGAVDSTASVSIMNCCFTGAINSALHNTGGLMGAVVTGTVSMKNCLNSGTVTSTGDSVGGIVGRMQKDTATLNMEYCLNEGDIKGKAFVGSAIGWFQKGKVNATAVYATETSDPSDTTKSFDNIGVGNNVNLNSGSINMIDRATITVSESLTADSIKTTMKGWGFDTDKIWTVGSAFESIPEIMMLIQYDTSWYSVSAKTGTITDELDLYGLAKLANEGKLSSDSKITLGNDIMVNTVDENTNVSDWKTTAPEYTWTPIGTKEHKFVGTFDGKGHTIRGIYVKSSTAGLGLFGYTASGSTIQNLKLENTYIHATADYAGGVVGVCAGNLVNVFSDVIMDSTNSYVGGLLGAVDTTGSVSITNCCFTGAINSASHNTGGLMGAVVTGTVNMKNCLNAGTVTSTGDSVGGIVGRMQKDSATLTMENCLNEGDIKGKAFVGSAIGWFQKGKVNATAVYATETSDPSDTTKSFDNIGVGNNVALNSGVIHMIDRTTITVSETLTSDSIRATMKDWGFDMENIWIIGTAKESLPKLLMTETTE